MSNSLLWIPLASNPPFCALAVLNLECFIVRALESLSKKAHFHSGSLMPLVGTRLTWAGQTGTVLDVWRNRAFRSCTIERWSTEWVSVHSRLGYSQSEKAVLQFWSKVLLPILCHMDLNPFPGLASWSLCTWQVKVSSPIQSITLSPVE